MLEEIARVLVCLAAGEALARAAGCPIPGPVTGLMLLYANLLLRGRLSDELSALADRLLQLLGMLFVPAGVGVVAYLDLLQAELAPIVAAVVGGTLITVLVTAVAAERYGLRLERRRQELDGSAGDVHA